MAKRSLADRLKGVDARVYDGALTVAITMLGVGSQFASALTNDEEFRDTDVLAVILGLLVCLPLYWRRRRPLVALTVSCVAITVLAIAEYRTNQLPIAPLFLTYAVGAYEPERRDVLGLLVPNAALASIYLGGAPDLDGGGFILNIVLFSGGWLAGEVVRARNAAASARLAEAEERAEAERQLAARSVAEERLRLAQELHDVVAHSMSVIAVQAGMGLHVLDARPDDSRRALEAISQTSRTSLQEIRRLLGVLRDEDGDLAHAPAPGLADLPRLVEDVRRAGVPIAFTTEGDLGGVPHGVELSVYRLVQEGLTNVMKHAGTASASVHVRCSGSAVDVEVVDDGRGAAAAAADAASNGARGHGLVGMRERVALWGGTLDAGPRAGGGYAVRAHLPYGEPA